jgi:hypothetical protein
MLFFVPFRAFVPADFAIAASRDSPRVVLRFRTYPPTAAARLARSNSFMNATRASIAARGQAL